MAKLIRNCFVSANYLIYPDGSHITWSYIDALQLLQCQENVRQENVRQSPLWTAAKRKNENQVAHSNPECFHHWCTWLAEFTLKLPQFQSAHATTKSISIIDRLFWLSKLKKPASRVLQSTTKLWKCSYERRSCMKQKATLKHWRKQVHVCESTV